MTLLSEFRIVHTAKQTGVNTISPPLFMPTIEKVFGFQDGVLANQADRLYAQDVSIPASGTSDLDLSGSLVDVFGNAVVFVKIVAVMTIADPLNANDVIVGVGTNPYLLGQGGTLPTFAVKPGGIDLKIAPQLTGFGTIANGVNDILRWANGGAGTAVNFRRILLGRSA